MNDDIFALSFINLCIQFLHTIEIRKIEILSYKNANKNILNF